MKNIIYILNIIILLIGVDIFISGILLVAKKNKALEKPKLLGILFVKSVLNNMQKKNKPTVFLKSLYSIKMMSIYWLIGGLLIIIMAILGLIIESMKLD